MKLHSLFLLVCCLASALQAQDTPPVPPQPPATLPTIRLAYFLSQPEEVSITISDVGTLKSVISGNVSGYFPLKAGSHTIEIKERFSGKPVFHETFNTSTASRSILAIYGKPGSTDFPPQLLSIPQAPAKSTPGEKKTENADSAITFFNFDAQGSTTVHTATKQEQLEFQLKPGEQKKVNQVPSETNNFTLDTASVPNQYDPAKLSAPPTMAGVSSSFLVFIYRPSDSSGAQTFITESGKEHIYAKEQ